MKNRISTWLVLVILVHTNRFLMSSELCSPTINTSPTGLKYNSVLGRYLNGLLTWVLLLDSSVGGTEKSVLFALILKITPLSSLNVLSLIFPVSPHFHTSYFSVFPHCLTVWFPDHSTPCFALLWPFLNSDFAHSVLEYVPSYQIHMDC